MSKPIQKPNSPWWRKHLVSVVLVSLLLLPVLYLEISSRIGFSQVSAESQRLHKILQETEKTLPMGGVAANTAYARGDGIGSTIGCFPDVRCPVVDKKLLVAIEEGKENAFVQSILQKFGYPQDEPKPCMPFTEDSSFCFTDTHGKFWLSLSINVADQYHHGAPANNDDIKPKVWRAVSLTIEQNP